MSAVNKRHSHSFAHPTDDPIVPQQERDEYDDETASSVRTGQAVTTSDGMLVQTAVFHFHPD